MRSQTEPVAGHDRGMATTTTEPTTDSATASSTATIAARAKGYTRYARPTGASFNPWLGQIDVKDLVLGAEIEDLTDEQARTLGEAIYNRLRTFPEHAASGSAEYDPHFESAAEEFDYVESVEDLIAAMDSLYDWADTARMIVVAR